MGKKEREEKRTKWKPPVGMVWNPLLGFERNNSCWCDSGKKAKRCCLPLVETKQRCVTHKEAELIRAEFYKRALRDKKNNDDLFWN